MCNSESKYARFLLIFLKVSLGLFHHTVAARYREQQKHTDLLCLAGESVAAHLFGPIWRITN